MNFENIELRNWQQFAEIDIAFHPRATIITGSNGSGKTTILSLLAKHRGWQHNFLATPKTDPVSHRLKYFSIDRIFGRHANEDRTIGRLRYTNGSNATIQAPETGAAQYELQIYNQQAVRFFYIPSHREKFSYRRLTTISTASKQRKEAFEELQAHGQNRYASAYTSESNASLMKSTLMGWMINGYGVHTGTKTVMPPDPSQVRNFEGFRDVLKTMLPETLGFEDLEIRDYEIVFSCNGGADEFLLETASGGISALIDIAWQVFMFDSESGEPFAVVIDEVENHLHPSMQRTLLPNLLRAFPRGKFIVSTHSPLIVTSVEDAHVYALKYDSDNKVRSYLLDFSNEVQNAVEVLDEVLGVSTTIPTWAVKKLKEIINKHANKDPTSESLSELRTELMNAGLGRLFPQAITSIAERNQ